MKFRMVRASHWRDCDVDENPSPHPRAYGRGGPHDYWFIDIDDLDQLLKLAAESPLTVSPDCIVINDLENPRHSRTAAA